MNNKRTSYAEQYILYFWIITIGAMHLQKVFICIYLLFHIHNYPVVFEFPLAYFILFLFNLSLDLYNMFMARYIYTVKEVEQACVSHTLIYYLANDLWHWREIKNEAYKRNAVNVGKQGLEKLKKATFSHAPTTLRSQAHSSTYKPVPTPLISPLRLFICLIVWLLKWE